MQLAINGTCNSTLEEMRIESEVPLVGTMTFHTLGLIIAAACALIAILISLWLIWMHALNYTKPYEQRHIIRILFMIPVYATASFLSFWFYWHAIYFQVISECYEAFAIASFFALLCHYIAPDLHAQKDYFRNIQPKRWVWPLNWFAKCCGGERGLWRTPRSGLTWFNIIWAGIYQYCFIRVAMTITAVVTQYFEKYCESSNSPVFAHIWVLVIEGLAVTVAMYCVIQFYIQLRADLGPHRPFLKVLAIKLVIFLSFWQSFMISILTSSTFNIVNPNPKIAYPDLKVGIPHLLLCIEMSLFSILHIWAFPYQPYTKGKQASEYPASPALKNELGPKQGGFVGLRAIGDAMNPWDLVKGFARGMRWLFIGVKHREKDASYKSSTFPNDNDMAMEPQPTPTQPYKRTESLPIAEEFRRSKFGLPGFDTDPKVDDEGAGLIAHAQPNPLNAVGGYVPARQRYDANGQDISSGGNQYDNQYGQSNPDRLIGINPTPGSMKRKDDTQSIEIGMAISDTPEPYHSHVAQEPYTSNSASQAYLEQKRQERQERQGRSAASPSEQWASSSRPTRPVEEDSAPPMHQALWGQPPRSQDQF